MILLVFATLMFGMDAMSDAVAGLADVPQFQNLFLNMNLHESVREIKQGADFEALYTYYSSKYALA